MKYRTIPAMSAKDLPKHLNLLRNLQEMHQSLVRLPETFPVLELGDIVPNLEGQVIDCIRRGNKILGKHNICTDLWNQRYEIDISVYAMSAHQLIIRKKVLISRLEQLVDCWQVFIDQIESSGEPAG